MTLFWCLMGFQPIFQKDTRSEAYTKVSAICPFHYFCPCCLELSTLVNIKVLDVTARTGVAGVKSMTGNFMLSL